MRYEMADTSTITGIQKAERLVNAGWKIYRSGLFLVYLCKVSK